MGLGAEDRRWYGRLFGWREDINLSERWWHRLFKVLYSLLLTLGLGVAFMAWTAQSEPEVTLANVRIQSTLSAYLTNADQTTPNIMPGFMALPGKLGSLNSETGQIEYLAEYYLSESWCSPDAPRYAEQIAEHLNQRAFGADQNTSLSVLAGISRVQKTPEEKAFCWFNSGVNNFKIDQVIKYQFTQDAKVAAGIKAAFKIVMIFLLANIILLNLYYRGFIYIIVGPRQS